MTCIRWCLVWSGSIQLIVLIDNLVIFVIGAQYSLVWKNGRKSSVTSDVFSSMFSLVGLMFGLVKFFSTDCPD